MKRILIVAQDTALRAAITRILQPAGYAVELAAGEKRARELSRDGRIDAAIVAPGSFGASGLTLARDLHSATGRVIVLADRAGEIGRAHV